MREPAQGGDAPRPSRLDAQPNPAPYEHARARPEERLDNPLLHKPKLPFLSSLTRLTAIVTRPAVRMQQKPVRISEVFNLGPALRRKIVASILWWPGRPARRAGACDHGSVPNGGMGSRSGGQVRTAGAKGRRRAVLLLVCAAFAAGIAAAVLLGRSAGPPDPMSADPHMRRGKEALDAGKAREALAAFDAARLRNPGRPEPLLAIARTLLTVAQARPALEAAQAACDAAPENAESHLVRGQTLEATGDRDGATAAYAHARTLDPRSPEPSYRLGRLAEARHQTEPAMRYYREALAADPGFAPAAHHLSTQLMASGAFEEAQQLLAAALDRVPGDVSLRLNLAHALLKRGDAAAALREFLAVLPRVPGRAEPRYHTGCALVALGRDDEALAAFNEALVLDRHLHYAWYALAQLLSRRGETEKAQEALARFSEARELAARIRTLEQQAANDPRNVGVLLDLGEAQLLRGRPREALRTLDRAGALDPANRRGAALRQRVREALDTQPPAPEE